MTKIITLACFLFFSLLLQAQDAVKEVKMADTMRSNGRIYVVVVVMLTILAGLALYLFRLDKKLKKLEKEIKS